MDARARDRLTTQRAGLLAAVLVVLAVWHAIPFGRQLLYPVTLFSTWVHELGHGLTALAVGGGFHQLLVFADGSGLALVSLPGGAVSSAAVSLGGLLAPPIAGAAILALARTPGRARMVLAGLVFLLAGSSVLWVRSVAGLIAMPLLAVLLGLLVVIGGRAALLTAHALGLLLTLLTVTRIDYLFTGSVEVDGERRTSDIGNVAEQLGGHYLGWGILVAGVSIAICVGGLWLAWGRGPAPRPADQGPMPAS